MRILLAHNFYRSSAPSGEDAVYRNEKVLLEENRFEVTCYERYNDALDDSTLSRRSAAACEAAWSKKTYEGICSLIRRTNPQVAHFHNTFPQISPSAYAACKDNGVPVVQTLHNFRLICPGALLLRNGRPCEDCVGGSLFPALRHACYRNSLPATAAVVWMLARNRWRGSYDRLVDTYIALTRFQAEMLIAGGLPAEKFRIKPNFVPDAVLPAAGKAGYALYVGHLSAHKGVRTLLEAWRQLPNLPLKVVGSGPLLEELVAYTEAHGLHVQFTGLLPRSEVLGLVRRAAVQVVPSECYEGFPLVIAEAQYCGTPVVASRIGGLPELVVEGSMGALFEPGNATDLAKAVGSVVAGLAGVTSRIQPLPRVKHSATDSLEALKSIYAALTQPSARHGDARGIFSKQKLATLS